MADASWPIVVSVGLRGYVVAVAVVLYLLPRMAPVRRQIQDKELRRRCCELSEEPFAFLEEHATPYHQQQRYNAALLETNRADTTQLLEKAVRHNDETEALFQERFGRRAERLLDASERHGWSTPEERKKLEARWWSLELPDDRIRRIAQHLENVCLNA